MQSLLATGHPAIPTTGDIDFTPLLYAALILIAVRRSHVPFSLWVVPAAIFAGGLIDSISDGFGPSMVTNVCILSLVAILIPLRGRRMPPIPPPEV
jgi:hypothetical protein